MKYAFLVSAVIEVLGGVVLYFRPELVFSGIEPLVMRIYGIAAFVIGMVCFQMYRNGQQGTLIYKNIFLTMMFFHAALSFVCYSARPEVLPLKLHACLLHLAVFVFFAVSYLKELQPDD